MIDFPRNLVPQKENLDEIAQVPLLIHGGICSPVKIADHFGQSKRHGSFFLNACKILGWIYKRDLTSSGLKIIKSSSNERYKLIKKAVLQCRIFRLIEKEFGEKWYLNANAKHLADFLEGEMGFAPATAKRRGSTLFAWAKYVSMEQKINKKDFLDKAKSKKEPYILTLVYSIKVKGISFDAGFVDGNGDPVALIIDSCKFGLIRSLKKITSINDDNLKFLLFISKKNSIKFNLALRGEYENIKDNISKIEIDYKDKSKYKYLIEDYLSNEKKLLKALNLKY